MQSYFRRRWHGEVGPAKAVITLRHVAEGLIVSLAYTLLAVALLHPWFSDPARTVATLKVNGGGVEVADVNLVMWILSWDWHALTTDPLRLFDANIFHPAPNTLAASEHLLGHLAIFGPAYGLSDNPVLAYQINFLGNLALSGTGLYALLRHWGLPSGAAFFGGLLYVFFPFRMHFANYTHLSAGQYAPLAVLFLDRTLLYARIRDAAAFCLCLLGQMLCSYYLAYFTLIALCGYMAGVVVRGRGRLVLRGVVFAAAAALIAGAVFAACSMPYLQLRSAGSIPTETDLRFLKLFSVGPWWDFLDRRNLHYVGAVPLSFAALGLLLPRRFGGGVPWARAAAVGIAVVCYAMAFGPEREIGGRTVTFPYYVVMHVIPGFSSMRAPIRFLLMAQLGFAALSSFGLAWLVLRVRGRFGSVAAVACAALVAVATVADFGLLSEKRHAREVAAGSAVPEVYRVLATVPRGPLLEIPSNRFYGHFRGAIIASEYMLYSTFHWLPLLDGYSGYAPPSAHATRALVAALPDSKALRLLVRTTGLRYVVVHRDLLPESHLSAWIQPPGLRQIGEFGSDLLFEVKRRDEPDLMDELIQLDRRCNTLLGVPLAPLSEDERRASFQTSYAPKMAVTGAPIGLDLTIVNESQAEWPALAAVGDHLVTIAYRWEDMNGAVVDEDRNASRLAYDLLPGESVRQRLAPVAPGRGEFRLIIGLVQDGEWFPTTAEPIPVTVRPISGLAGLAAEGAAELLESLERKAAGRD
jgi:hypothetical protein